MDNVLIVVEDLEAAIAFFIELGMELEGRMEIEGEWVDRVIGIDSAKDEIATLRTPDGHSRLELTQFERPAAVGPNPRDLPVNALGYRRIMFAVDDLDDCWPASAPMEPSSSVTWCSTRMSIGSASSTVPRASSSALPSRSRKFSPICSRIPPRPALTAGKPDERLELP